MIVKRLLSELTNSLARASEIYIAVALMKDRGLKIIEDSVPISCVRKYLVGLDLPTTPSVLRKLLELENKNDEVKAKIYTSRVYHPKVYLIKNGEGTLTAFVGSGNATFGGLQDNIEMTVKIEDQEECDQLYNWFDELFEKGTEFDIAFIERYEKIYRQIAVGRSKTVSGINQLLDKPAKENGIALNVPSEQYFEQDDYDAFAPMYHSDNSQEANMRRKVVREKLMIFDQNIFPEFEQYGLTDLHRHPFKTYWTSQYFHSRGSLSPKDAIWLHYGRSKAQLNGNNFTNSPRIQLILRNTSKESYVGVWLFIGMPGGSTKDRLILKKKLNDPIFLELFYQYFLELGSAYWINIDNIDDAEILCNNMTNFKNTLLRDDLSGYYIIGKNYHPGDNAISKFNIEETVLVEFSKLFQLYRLIVG